MPITSIRFNKFKAFREYSISFKRMNVLVGPNNCGKSTILSAFRLLEQALRTAGSRRASRVKTHAGHPANGHYLSPNTLPISMENVHYNYDASDSRIEIRYFNGNRLFLFFPEDGGATLYWNTSRGSASTPSGFRREFPDRVQVIPVLGPIEQKEPLVTDDTVRRAAGTPRASRHFRNYWWKNPEGFEAFQQLIAQTWPGMVIGKPEIAELIDPRLTMFVSENRIDRELFWSGLGFQIWCQLLTHISRCSESDLLVIDEPEIYLHPELQRQLIGILREVRPDIILATHSVEILGEVDPSEISLVDKTLKSAKRLHDIDAVQQAIDQIGSIQNITLTELARNRRLLFVEGNNDFKIIRRFAKVLGYADLAAGGGLTVLESGGFESWKKVLALAWGFKRALGTDVRIGVIYDSDYRSTDEISKLRRELEREIQLVHFHTRKEIENYLLSPSIIQRAIEKTVGDRNRRQGEALPMRHDLNAILDSITNKLKTQCSAQYISKYCEFFRSSGKDQATLASEALELFEEKWPDLATRMEVVPGKNVLKSIRDNFQKMYRITLTDFRLIDAHTPQDVPEDIVELVRRLEMYKNIPRVHLR